MAAGAVVSVIATDAFTLAWTHSVERTEWREAWRIEAGRLVLDEARIAGSGAGMEPPAGARLAGGTWRYRPALPPLPALTLAVSGIGEDYQLCWAATCAPFRTLLPAGGDGPVTLRACGEE
jgi:hypothetical protein